MLSNYFIWSSKKQRFGLRWKETLPFWVVRQVLISTEAGALLDFIVPYGTFKSNVTLHYVLLLFLLSIVGS
jgi:hypothetical protein